MSHGGKIDGFLATMILHISKAGNGLGLGFGFGFGHWMTYTRECGRGERWRRSSSSRRDERYEMKRSGDKTRLYLRSTCKVLGSQVKF